MWGWDVCDMLSGCEWRDTGAARPDLISQSGARMSRQWTNQRRAPAGSAGQGAGLHSQLTMGGCCSKLNISGPGASSKGLETDVDKTRTGDTPKLSRLQHKESFSNGHVKPSDHSNVTSNGGGPGATPSLAGATQQR